MSEQHGAEALQRRAAEIKHRYNQVRTALKDRPGDPALRDQARLLKQQYDALARQFQAASPQQQQVTPQAASPPNNGGFSPVILDDDDWKPSKPVVMNTGPSIGERIGSVFAGANVLRLGIGVPLILILFGIIGLIGTGRISFYQVPTESMMPTLQPGDRIVARRSASYERGDVIVIPDPNYPEDYLVKRLVALPGDTVEIYSGQLHVNETAITEPYLRERIEYGYGPYTVGAGEVFLLGDNRNESEDSARWNRGLPMSQIKGRAIYIYAPGDRRGSIETSRDAFASVP